VEGPFPELAEQVRELHRKYSAAVAGRAPGNHVSMSEYPRRGRDTIVCPMGRFIGKGPNRTSYSL
jgi:hypothetical protein